MERGPNASTSATASLYLEPRTPSIAYSLLLLLLIQAHITSGTTGLGGPDRYAHVSLRQVHTRNSDDRGEESCSCLNVPMIYQCKCCTLLAWTFENVGQICHRAASGMMSVPSRYVGLDVYTLPPCRHCIRYGRNGILDPSILRELGRTCRPAPLNSLHLPRATWPITP